MGFGKAIHYVGTFMLLCAAIFMLVASISAPTIHHLSLLKIDWHGGKPGVGHTYFGAFGYCETGSGGCYGPHIGYSPGRLVDGVSGIDMSNASRTTVKGLAHAFILHPVAAGISFIAFLLSLKTGFLNLVTTLVAVLAFILAVVNLAIDFAAFSIIHHDVNDDSPRASARFGAAIWLVVAAAIANLAGAVIVFMTCCAGRRRAKYENRKIHAGY